MDHGLSKEFLLSLSTFIEATINRKVTDEVTANQKKMSDEIHELKDKLTTLEAKKAAKTAAKVGNSARSGSKKTGKSVQVDNDASRQKVWSKNAGSSGAAEAGQGPSTIPKPTKVSKDSTSASGSKKASGNNAAKSGNMKYVAKDGNSASSAHETPKVATTRKSVAATKKNE